MAHKTNKLETSKPKLRIDGSSKATMTKKLTPKMQNIYSQAREYAKSNSYKYCWYFDGNIYLKKDDGDLPNRVKSEADLIKLREGDFLDVSRITFEGGFNLQVVNLLDHVRLTRSELLMKVPCLLDDLCHALGSIWPDLRVHPFGSIVNGLGIKTSDVDCYVQLPSDLPPQNPVIRARNVLKKDNSRFTQAFAITKARVPILKFIHIPTGFKCDINFSNFSGVKNSELIAFLLGLDSRALPLAIILKYWSKVYDLTGTNLIPNYALTLMIIFYLQEKSVLPSVAELQQHVGGQWVGHWNTAFNDSFRFHRYNTQSLYELVGGFFDYYNSFDYEKFVISPFLGFPVKKQQLRDLKGLPSTFLLYKQNVLRQKCELINTYTAVCIQDPFDHSRNCATAVSAKLMNIIQGHIRIVLRKFIERPREHFLREMFTHKLAYEPVESLVVRDSKPIIINKDTYIKEYAKYVEYSQNRISMHMLNTSRAQYHYSSRYQPARLNSPNSNQNKNEDRIGQFLIHCVLFILGVVWLHLALDTKKS